MGRVVMYTVLASLVAFVLTSYFLLEHGGAEMGLAREATLHDLTSEPRIYEGAIITTSGTLSHNASLNQYEIATPDANFPLPIRNFDESKLAPLVGLVVRVSGQFGSDGGLHINADSVVWNTSPTPVPVGT
jgi:hypothetical protein